MSWSNSSEGISAEGRFMQFELMVAPCKPGPPRQTVAAQLNVHEPKVFDRSEIRLSVPHSRCGNNSVASFTLLS